MFARRSRVALVALAATCALVASAEAGGVASRGGSFQQCGDYPADFTYQLRVDGVGCSRGKKVSERYYQTTVDQQQANVRFGSWKCKSENYGDGGYVKCKNGSKQVRFAMGG